MAKPLSKREGSSTQTRKTLIVRIAEWRTILLTRLSPVPFPGLVESKRVPKGRTNSTVSSGVAQMGRGPSLSRKGFTRVQFWQSLLGETGRESGIKNCPQAADLNTKRMRCRTHTAQWWKVGETGMGMGRGRGVVCRWTALRSV